jgi:hypothetical protein
MGGQENTRPSRGAELIVVYPLIVLCITTVSERSRTFERAQGVQNVK